MIGLALVVVVGAFFVLRACRTGMSTRASVWSMRALIGIGAIFVFVAIVPVETISVVVVQSVLIALVLAMVAAWLTSRHPKSQPALWAEAHGVVLTDTNTGFVTDYVVEGHRLRLACGFGGAIALAALSRGLGIEVPVSGWVWLMGGYLGGVVWSEAWLTRLPAGTTRLASLTPRRVRDYLVGRLRVAQAVVPAIALLLGGAAFVVSGEPPLDSADPHYSEISVGALRRTVALIGVASAALSLGVAWLQRSIVTKPQPTTDADLIVADDAVRASSVHLLSGTAIGIVLVCVGSQLSMLSQLGSPGGGLLELVGLASWFAALIAWRYYGHRGWVVRKHPPASSPLPARLEGVGS